MASILKVDTIQDQDGNNIINESANTITIGASGDTITIPSGATLANSGIVTGFESTGIDDNATSTAITIDSSENVGIGTSSPSKKLEINTGTLLFSGDIDQNTTSDIALSGNSVIRSQSDLQFVAGDSSGADEIIFYRATSGTNVDGKTGATESMRIESDGDVGLGKTHTDANTVSGIKFYQIGVQYMYAPATIDIMRFYNSTTGTEVGDIRIATSSTSYNTSSDYRLKENVSYDFDATTRLKQLKPARFNFIADADTTVDGFLAHEVSSVVPEAITGTKDAVQVWEEGDELPEGVSVGDNKLDENGNTIPDYQGIDQSKLVPLLVKTIQELEARITTLENA